VSGYLVPCSARPAGLAACDGGLLLESSIREPSQLSSGGDSELREHLPKVPLDGSRTEVERGSNLRIGSPCTTSRATLAFEPSVRQTSPGFAFGPSCLPRGKDFASRPVRERFDPHRATRSHRIVILRPQRIRSGMTVAGVVGNSANSARIVAPAMAEPVGERS
jgi:hypothetical protein